jgi:hypothetical protein
MHLQKHCPPAEPRTGAQRTAAAPILILAILAGLASLPAHAAGSFPLSSCSGCAQNGPGAVAGNPQGAFMAAWTNSPSSPQPVAARFFKPDGTPRGADLLLSAAAPLAPGDAAVAAEGTGFFAAAWSRKDGLNSEIIVQRYRRTTAPLGGPITVSVDEPGSVKPDFSPAVAFLADGSLLVAWQRYGLPVGGSPASSIEVMARRINFRNGRAFGPPSKVSSGLVDEGRVALCANKTGAVAAAWTSLDRIVPFLPSLRGAVFRRLTPSGQPFGSEVPLAAPTSTIGGVALACSASSFTAAWRSDQSPAQGRGIVIRRIATNGALGAPSLVSPNANAVSAPSAFEDARGNSLVTWVTDDGSTARVLFRRVEASGDLGSAVVASTVTRSAATLRAPAVSAIGRAGDFVLVWTGDAALYGRRFSASGTPLATRATAADLEPDTIDQP